ncbi:MAG TPA: glycosyltransferase family 2 protein [Bacteroidales bacterium]|nr:glycosyltransferase family 2 protein [Bacteroidales bacterium]
MIKTAVVILNWNSLLYLKMFLHGVVEHSVDNETIVCIADNGSNDGSVDWISENFADIRLLRLEKNHGYAGGYNLALDQLDARYFVLLNSDIEVTPGWLKPLISHMDHSSDVASCQPKILSHTNKDQFEYAGAAGGFIDKYGYTFCRGRIFDVIETDTGQYNDLSDIFWSTGACMVVRAEAWKRCFGFDSDFFAHMEEVDLCWRFRNAGYRISYIPDSVVYHIGGGTLAYDSPFKTYLNFRNNLFLLYKNLPDNKLHTVIFIRKLLDSLAALLFLFKGKTTSIKAVWKAHIDYYKSISNLKKKRASLKRLHEKQTERLILNKSIVFEFYIRGRKTFSSLQMKINQK